MRMMFASYKYIALFIFWRWCSKLYNWKNRIL